MVVMALLLSLVQDVRPGDGVRGGGRVHLQVGSLGPEMDVGAVPPAVLLLGQVEREHPHKDPKVAVLQWFADVDLLNPWTDELQEVFDPKGGRRVGKVFGGLCVLCELAVRHGSCQPRDKGPFYDPEGIELAQSPQKVLGHSVGRGVLLERQLDVGSVLDVAGKGGRLGLAVVGCQRHGTHNGGGDRRLDYEDGWRFEPDVHGFRQSSSLRFGTRNCVGICLGGVRFGGVCVRFVVGQRSRRN
mmetsp:Transcript_2378/g.5271  ORF Transcript_2378/g.5271 Transcript_2378/m.5271 type:complete len:243 (-) Transcript_2378:222-950(-)